MKKHFSTIYKAVAVAMVSVAIGACNSTNKPADGGEKIIPDTACLQGEWHLESYRIDCASTQFDATSGHRLSFDESDSRFNLSTDCNMISGEFVIKADTIRFKNMLVTEMACDDMTVEQNMLRLLNDSTAYALCHGDTIDLTASGVGSAIFIRNVNDKNTSAESGFIGEYTNPDDGSSLLIGKDTNSDASIKISLIRLTDIDNGIGKVAGDTLTFTATDAAGSPIKGKIALDGDTATVIFTESTWEYLPDGTTLHFKRNADN